MEENRSVVNPVILSETALWSGSWTGKHGENGFCDACRHPPGVESESVNAHAGGSPPSFFVEEVAKASEDRNHSANSISETRYVHKDGDKLTFYSKNALD